MANTYHHFINPNTHINISTFTAMCKTITISIYVLILACTSCKPGINNKIHSGKLLDFGIKHAHEPNCDAMYLITEIENCEALKTQIQPDSIQIILKGGCFDSIEFSNLSPRIRYMYSNTFSITARTCSYITYSQDWLDSIAQVWQSDIQIEIQFGNRKWKIVGKS